MEKEERMALTECNECKRKISDTIKACPHCGAEIRKPESPFMIVGAIVLTISFFAIKGCFFTGSGSNPENKTFGRTGERVEETKTIYFPKRLKYKEEAIRQFRSAYLKEHPNLSERDEKAITNGYIYIGMSGDKVIASWGDPLKINRNVTSDSTLEQWIFGPPTYYGGETLVYLNNGIVVGWQDE